MTHTTSAKQPSAFYQWLEKQLQPFVPVLIFYPHWTQHNKMVVIFKALNDKYDWDKCTIDSLRQSIINERGNPWEYEAFHSILIDWLLCEQAWLKDLVNTEKVVNCSFCGGVLNQDKVELHDIKEDYEDSSENDNYTSRAVLIADVSNVIIANIKLIKREDGLLLFEASSGEAVGMAVDESEAIGKMLASDKPCLRANYPCLGKNWVSDIALCN